MVNIDGKGVCLVGRASGLRHANKYAAFVFCFLKFFEVFLASV